MSHICLYNDKRNIRNDQNECNISLIVGCQASIEYLYKQVMERAAGNECDVSLEATRDSANLFILALES